MTLMTHPTPERADASVAEKRVTRGRIGVPLLLQATAMLGIGALLYPTAAEWVATLEHNSEVSGYVERADALPDSAKLTALAAAEAYNARMPLGPLRDPFATATSADALTADDAAYDALLGVDGSDVIGELDYPELGISLPIRHGTSDEVISQGVGHLYGSSLPIGGPSTHSVLTSHSGLVNASLFTPLSGARTGDVFSVAVLGETRWYRVDHIATVAPDETDALQIVDGEDHITLVTCTPIGINSHRLLVRGTRIDGPEGDAGTTAIAGDGRDAGFPWWALIFLGGSAATAWILFAPGRRRRDGEEASA